MRILGLYGREYGVDVDVGGKLDFRLVDFVCRIVFAKLANTLAALGKEGEEESNANHSVAAIVEFGIYYTAIAFAANHGTNLFHLGGNVYLADSSSLIFAATCTCHIA